MSTKVVLLELPIVQCQNPDIHGSEY